MNPNLKKKKNDNSKETLITDSNFIKFYLIKENSSYVSFYECNILIDRTKEEKGALIKLYINLLENIFGKHFLISMSCPFRM